MIGVVIIAHGELGQLLLQTVEFILGPQPNFKAVTVEDQDDRAEKSIEISKVAQSVDEGSGVILVLDVVGSSPANLTKPALKQGNRIALYGANLPMLLTLARSRSTSLSEAARQGLDAGRKYIDSYDPNREDRLR